MAALLALAVAGVFASASAFQQQRLDTEVSRRYEQAPQASVDIPPTQPEPRHLKTDVSRTNETNKEHGEQDFWPLDQIFGRDEEPDYSDRQRLHPEDALSLYQSMHIVNSLFKAHNITYWAGGGTLLGAMRNKGVIPHDDDIDIHIPKDYSDRLFSAALKTDLEINGLKLIAKDPGQWGITNKTLRSAPLKHGLKTKRGVIKSKEPPYPFWIDVYLMYLIGADHTDGGEWKFMHKDKFYRPRAFTGNVTEFPFVKLSFGDTFVFAPQEDITKPYLARLYGSDWETHVNCQGTHHSCRLAKDEQWALRHCAEPTGPLREAKLATADDAIGEPSL
jgi:hypothetical protein